MNECGRRVDRPATRVTHTPQHVADIGGNRKNLRADFWLAAPWWSLPIQCVGANPATACHETRGCDGYHIIVDYREGCDPQHRLEAAAVLTKCEREFPGERPCGHSSAASRRQLVPCRYRCP